MNPAATAALQAQLVNLAHAEHLSRQCLLVAIAREVVEKWNTAARQDVLDSWDERNRPPNCHGHMRPNQKELP